MKPKCVQRRGKQGPVKSILLAVCAQFEVLIVVKIEVEVFWFVMPCRTALGYHHFRGLCCLHL
jgi:hypothetical protein